MMRRNGTPTRTRQSERRGYEAQGEAVRARCQTCDRPLPLGLARHYCLEHSDYPQRLRVEIDRLERLGQQAA